MQNNLGPHNKPRKFNNHDRQGEEDSLFYPNQQEAVKWEKLEKKASKLKSRKEKRQYNRGPWSNQENIAYKEFLQRNTELFQKNLKERKANKIHVLMSNFILYRTSTQCRSHHQKMVKYYGDLASIISFIDGLDGVQQQKKIEANNETMIPMTPIPIDLEMQEINQEYLPPLTLWQSLVQVEEEERSFLF